MAGWTTGDLLTRAKLYSFYTAAASGAPLSDTEILVLADDELQSYVFPRVLSAAGEWRVRETTTALVASTSTYRLPSRAHLGRLRDVLYVGSDGSRWSVPQIDAEALGTIYTSAQTATAPSRFYLADGSLKTFPAMGTSVAGSLQLKYYARPGTLVATSAAAKISAIGAAGSGGAGYRRFTCATVPTSITTSVTLDHIRADGGLETEHIDLAVNARVTGASGTIDILETSFTVANISVGDYFCLAHESCIPQIPNAMHPWLARRTAAAILEQLDPQAANAAQQKADEVEAEILSALQPRVDGELIPFINPFSTIRQMTS